MCARLFCNLRRLINVEGNTSAIHATCTSSDTTARAALAQSTSFCTVGAPLTPTAPTISPSTLMGNPPPQAATRASVGMPAKSDGSPWMKLKKSCVETPNRAVYALFCAISMVGSGVIHPAKGLEIAAVIENRYVLGNAEFSGFRHRCIHHVLCSSEEMLCFFTTLAIGPPPSSVCTVTAVDVEDVTRDERGFVRRDEHDALGDRLHRLGGGGGTDASRDQDDWLVHWLYSWSQRLAA